LIVEVLDDDSSAAMAEQEGQARQESTAQERRLADDTERLANYTHALAIATTALAVVAAGQLAMFLWQLVYMRKTTRDATVAAQAADATAQATRDLVTQNREHLLILERGYVFAGPKGIEKEKERPGTVTIGVYAQSVGRTPGFVKEVYARSSPSEPTGEPSYPNDVPVYATDLIVSTGDGGVKMPVEFVEPLSDPLFFYGYIRYVDIFHEPIRESRFCMRVHPDIGKWEFAGSGAWNGWD
jgi:hypothetical protein